MMRSSSRKRLRSRLRRKRIKRRRSLNASDIVSSRTTKTIPSGSKPENQCSFVAVVLDPHVKILRAKSSLRMTSPEPPQAGLHIRAPRGDGSSPALIKNGRDRDQSRNRPPQHESKFQNQLGQIELQPDPRESAPDQRGTEKSKQPADSGDDPKKRTAGGSRRRLLSAEANTQLRTRRKIAWDRDRNRAQRVKQFAGGSNFPRAIAAIAEMPIEPSLVSHRKSFDERLGEEFLRAFVEVFAHAAP